MTEQAGKVFRGFLIIVGLILLVVFGGLAASQARNKRLAGSAHPSVYASHGSSALKVLGVASSPALSVEPLATASTNQSSAYSSLNAKTPSPNGSVATDRSLSSHATIKPVASGKTAPAPPANKDIVNDTVTTTTSEVHQTVTSVTDALTGRGHNDFMSLWP